jgi:hypothetical protein
VVKEKKRKEKKRKEKNRRLPSLTNTKETTQSFPPRWFT